MIFLNVIKISPLRRKKAEAEEPGTMVILRAAPKFPAMGVPGPTLVSTPLLQLRKKWPTEGLRWLQVPK